MPFVYILRCSDSTLYAGHSNHIATREKTHNDGHGSRYTPARRSVRVVYSEEHDSNQERDPARAPAEALDGQEEGSADRWSPLDFEITQQTTQAAG